MIACGARVSVIAVVPSFVVIRVSPDRLGSPKGGRARAPRASFSGAHAYASALRVCRCHIRRSERRTADGEAQARLRDLGRAVPKVSRRMAGQERERLARRCVSAAGRFQASPARSHEPHSSARGSAAGRPRSWCFLA
jgi:hypothetical protein